MLKIMLKAYRSVALFIFEYFLSRSAKSLMASAPAVLAIAGIAYFLYVRENNQTVRFIDKYRIAFDASARQQDADEMWVLARTLVELQPGDPEARFLLSQALVLREETGPANAILLGLAPENRSGYAPAHSMLADHLLRSMEEEVTREKLNSLIHHLKNSHRANHPHIKFQLGIYHLAAGETMLAESYFRDADLPQADLELAKLFQSRNEAGSYKISLDRARQQFETNSKSNPRDFLARVGWINTLLLQGDIDTVIRLLDETQANNPESRLTIANLYVEASQFIRKTRPLDVRRTTALLEKAYQIEKTSPLVLNWAIALLESGVEFSSDLPTELRDQLEQEASHKPEDEDLLFLLARLQAATGASDLAMESFLKLTETAPVHHLNLAKLYHRENNFAASQKHAQLAIDYFSEQSKQEPEQSIRINHAEALCYLEKWDQARNLLKELKPEASAQREVSKTWVMQAAGLKDDQWQQRHQYLRSAYDSNPTAYLPVRLLANGLAHEGARHDSAQEQLHQILAQGRYRDLIHLILGTDAARFKDWPRAVQHLEQAHQLRPQDPMILNNLAYAILQIPAGSAQQALEYAELANKMVPNHPEILSTRGEAYLRLNQFQKSISDLETAAATLKNRKELHALLAKAYTALNNPAAAKQHQLLSE